MKTRLFISIALLFIPITLAVMFLTCGAQTQEELDLSMNIHITKFNYEGHKFLLFKEGITSSAVAGICHDPNCPCHKNVNKEQ